MSRRPNRRKRNSEIGENEYSRTEKHFDFLCKCKRVLYWPPMRIETLQIIRGRLNSRNSATENWFTEVLFWNKVYGFLKNWPIANRFFADFYFPKAQIVVELDGPEHDKAYDSRRDRIFRQYNIKIFRLKNGDKSGMEKIVSVLKENADCKKFHNIEKKKASEKAIFDFCPPKRVPVSPTPDLFLEKNRRCILIRKRGAESEEKRILI